MKNKEKLASSIEIRCQSCMSLLHADSEDLQLEGEVGVNSNFYFYIKCPACHARVIIPPESWPTEE